MLHRGTGLEHGARRASAPARDSCTSSRFPKASRSARSRRCSRRKLGQPIDSVDAAVRDTALLHQLDVPTPTLEGYLFPDTYIFPEATTARAAVDAMVRRFEQVWKPEWTARLDTLHLSRNDVHGARVDRREGGEAPRGAPGDRRGVPEPAAARHAAAGRSDGAIRARQARRARVLQGPRGRIAVQHVQAQGTAARARSRRPGARASRRRCIRRTCRSSTSSPSPTATTSSAATSPATRRRSSRRAGRGIQSTWSARPDDGVDAK